MLIEACSVPKYRDLSRPGDDILAVLAGRLYAVFDGVTDSTGNEVQGTSPGRFAASQAAVSMMMLAGQSHIDMSRPHDWLVSMNQTIAHGLQRAGKPIMRVGTTAAIVLDAGDGHLHFLVVGDSGIRINGQELILLTKDVDVLFAAARVAIFRCLQARGFLADDLEARARQLVFSGLSTASSVGLLAADLDGILEEVRVSCLPRLRPDAMEQLEVLLFAGIRRGQWAYCNRAGHSLGYAVINGGETQGPDMRIFSRRKSSVQSLELFTDGYMSVPIGTHVHDWEEEFIRVEAADFTKTATYASTKGSSPSQFSDDRTVLVVQM